MKKSYKETIFFTLTFISLIVLSQSTNIISRRTKIKPVFCTIISATILTLLLLGLFYLLKMESSVVDDYQLLDISPSKKCRGGDYMHQGSSKFSKFCRDYTNSPEGKEQMARHKCQVGNIGWGPNEFEFTPQSDENWKNAQCVGNNY
jgi:hypothetical protein